MDFHHVCLIVTDMDQSLVLFRDVLGFSPYIDIVIPDEDEAFFAQSTLDDIFGVPGARSRMVMLVSPTGAKIELQQPSVPIAQMTPRDRLDYGHSGIREIAFTVESIDTWWATIRAAGYETQTDYVWSVGGGRLRSFLFYDADGNLIQLCEEPSARV